MINKKFATKKKIVRTLTVALCLSMGLTGCGKKNATEEVTIDDNNIVIETEIAQADTKKDDSNEAKKEDKDQTSDMDNKKENKKEDKKTDKKTDKSDKSDKEASKDKTNKTGKKKGNETVELEKNVTSESSSNNKGSNTSNSGSNSSNNSAKPTVAPTAKPGAVPTAAPTAKPTPAPTAAPTAKPTAKPSEKPVATPTPAPTPTPEEKFVLDDSYTLVWQDEFNGAELNSNDWNVEEHAAGWVNKEHQAYVNSTDNIYIKDGKLVIQPLKDADGKITSGRVNTQGKHDFKYGYYECSAKVPAGYGYLPAFWMMPTNESLYGQWPRCGEIDIMEVWGQKTDTVYGTIHYGNPHTEGQKTKTLASGNFADEYHTFAVDWQPGSIKWYVDGILYHEENDWFSATDGVGELAYPAPFDQPFYMILNVAVGGDWVGHNLDATTKFDESSQLVVDYVRVYQKDSYDENVTKPESKPVELREPDANGNYVNNGNFAVAEDLSDDVNWKFMTAQGGEAGAAIANNEIKIDTTKAGSVDYSVQLVQAGIPLKKGGTYTVTFDAKASDNRSMNTAVKAPDRGYSAYMSNNADLTTDWQTYTYTFTMNDSDDANARLEFNMGAAGTAGIEIKNVKLVKDGQLSDEELSKKTVLANGNLVYNGNFDQGAIRLGEWSISDKSKVSVTNANNTRELHATGDVVLSQDELAFADGSAYELSFKGRGNGTVTVTAAGKTETFTLTDTNATYKMKLTKEAGKDKNFKIEITGNDVYIDDVMLCEDALIKNGSFDNGLVGYEFYVNDSAKATCAVDSLSNANAASIDVTKTRTDSKDTQNWYIQLKQGSINLEEGKTYKLTLDAKSTVNRKLMVAIQRNGNSDKHKDDYTGYLENKVFDVTGEYATYSYTFKMSKPTDDDSVLSINFGTIEDTDLAKHTVYIDNIKLEEVEAQPEEVITPKVEPGVNMVTNLNRWACAGKTLADSEVQYDENTGTYTLNIKSLGQEEYSVQLGQQYNAQYNPNDGLHLIKGKKYRITFDIVSNMDRDVKLTLRETSGYQGMYDSMQLTANTSQTYSKDCVWEEDSTKVGAFTILMGNLDNANNPTLVNGDVNTVKISNVKVYEVPEGDESTDSNPESGDQDNPPVPAEVEGSNTVYWFGQGDGTEGYHSDVNGEHIVAISDALENPWDVQVCTDAQSFVKGTKYRLYFDVESTINRKMTIAIQDANQEYGGYAESIDVEASKKTTICKEFVWGINDVDLSACIQLGNTKDATAYESHTVRISNVRLVTVTAAN